MDTSELLHLSSAAIGTKFCLPPHPLCAFLGNGPLSQFVLELNLKLAAVEAAFSFGLRNVKFTAFLPAPVRHFTGNKRW